MIRELRKLGYHVALVQTPSGDLSVIQTRFSIWFEELKQKARVH
jgi:hypothetical protein